MRYVHPSRIAEFRIDYLYFVNGRMYTTGMTVTGRGASGPALWKTEITDTRCLRFYSWPPEGRMRLVGACQALGA